MVVLLLMFGWLVGWMVGSSNSSRPGYNHHEEEVREKKEEEEEQEGEAPPTNITHSLTQLHHRSLEEKKSLLTELLLHPSCFPSLLIRALPTNVSVTLI